jgi:hypothetical protein
MYLRRRGSAGQPRGDPSPGDPHPLQQHDERQPLRGRRLRTGQRHLGNRGLGVLDELYTQLSRSASSHTGPPRYYRMDTVPAYVDWRACRATPLSRLTADYKVSLKLRPQVLPVLWRIRHLGNFTRL